MDLVDEDKTTFIIELTNYWYKVMPFALTNVTITYQQLMDKVFGAQLRRNLEVYVDNMFIKSDDLRTHIKDLEEVFGQLRKNNIMLNPEKCL